ncbi:MAG: hypothetical protein M5U14_02630 [Acidimicrobiia bacterium]|nr:hypothetical protein [Acidimicrobiia bacterium]
MLALAVANLRRGRAGRRLVAVRTNERAAAALGISVFGAKLYAFGLSAAIAGAGACSSPSAGRRWCSSPRSRSSSPSTSCSTG